MKKLLFLNLPLLLLWAACQTTPHKESILLDKDDYSLRYDSSLTLDESGTGGITFALLTKKENIQDDFVENLNLMIQNLGEHPMDLDQFVKFSEEQIKIHGKIRESKRKHLDDKTFHQMIFEAELNGHDLKFFQHYYIKNSDAYILTYTAKRVDFDTYLHIMTKTMESFVLK